MGLLNTLWDQSAPVGLRNTHRIHGYLWVPGLSAGSVNTPWVFLETLWDQGAPLEFHNTPWNTGIPVGPCAIHGTLEHP